MMVEAFVRQSFFSSQLLADGAKFKSICYGLRPATCDLRAARWDGPYAHALYPVMRSTMFSRGSPAR